ncbi:hypothetical protein HYH03_016356 [Edaphochlamys debaryana]|uniref:Methyltransferase domain-containing protein n=1 Tax=Edaphochlamys debaryana TaxID=47281 RepID=A0A836BQ84_9CHLO|nr:hypothetical protein HYH03_016356 [Edaphochlamys debaryana]|eukprot:KAG2484870.1 hypothetical protein HYH03_016356 [Edaphochlamys debaryana]
MEPAVWDGKYAGEDFAYGKEPNEFVRQCVEQYLKEPCHVVELASGEGRNVAYLAGVGHRVTAVDFSPVGLEKTSALTRALHGEEALKRVEGVQADIMSWRPHDAVDAVVLSFCHVPARERRGFVEGLVEMLHPGGLVICEVFHPDQVAKGYRQTSGGPTDPTMMVTLQEMRELLGSSRGTEIRAEEVEYVLKEGKLHDGLGAVTRYLWRKGASA